MQFMEVFFNFDNKLYRTLKDVWIPNKITFSYLSGKKNKYVNPFRFFFVCLVIFFALSAWSSRNKSDTEQIKQQTIEVIQYDFNEKRKQLDPDSTNSILDSIQMHLFKSQSVSQIIDDQKTLQINLGEENLNSYDTYKLSKDSLYAKYDVVTWYDKYIFDQRLKFQEQNIAFVKLFINNMLWGIVLFTLLGSIVLKLVFIRHSSFYLEHLLQIINFQCLVMIGMSMIVILKILLINEEMAAYMDAIWIFLCFCHLIYSLSKYYHQGIIMMSLKALILFTLFPLILSAVLVAILSFSFLTI